MFPPASSKARHKDLQNLQSFTHYAFQQHTAATILELSSKGKQYDLTHRINIGFNTEHYFFKLCVSLKIYLFLHWKVFTKRNLASLYTFTRSNLKQQQYLRDSSNNFPVFPCHPRRCYCYSCLLGPTFSIHICGCLFCICCSWENNISHGSSHIPMMP